MYFTHAPRQRLAILPMAIALCLIAAAVTGAGGPRPAASPLDADGQMRLSPSDRCPVCAMFPARQPEAAAAMRLKNGMTFYFCSNGCLLRAFLRPAAYLGTRSDDIVRLVARDYFSGKPVDGREATWVAGSDVVGPMGPAIIALADASQLKTFNRRHGGNTVFTLDQLNDDLWRRIGHHDLPPAPSE